MVFSPTGDIAPTFAPKKAKVKKEQKNFCPSHTQASPFGGESKPPPPGEVAARRADGEGYAHRTPCGFVGADAHAQRKSPWGTSARKTFATAAVDGGAMWASPPTTSQETSRTPSLPPFPSIGRCSRKCTLLPIDGKLLLCQQNSPFSRSVSIGFAPCVKIF